MAAAIGISRNFIGFVFPTVSAIFLTRNGQFTYLKDKDFFIQADNKKYDQNKRNYKFNFDINKKTSEGISGVITEIWTVYINNDDFQSIVNSNSEFAIDIKRMIKEKLIKGENKHEIFKFLKSKYGDYVLFDPPFQFNTLMLWLLPFLLLILGTSFLAVKYIKFKKK